MLDGDDDDVVEENPIAVEEEKEKEKDVDDLMEEDKTQQPQFQIEEDNGRNFEEEEEDDDDVVQEKQQVEEEEEPEEELEEEPEEKLIEQDDEPEGMDLSSPLHAPPMDDGLVLGLVLDTGNHPNVTRRPTKKKKTRRLNQKKQAALDRKLKLIRKNLHPVPFVPAKKLNFAKHEDLLKRLGLWDFVNMEFDGDIRSDLLALVIASYNSSHRYSIVNDVRIRFSRADLARALKLPVKKEKSNSLETSDFDSEAVSEESKLFILDFMSNWVLLLHDDTWILPKEVVNASALIRDGQLHKVDWPGLIWFMVEKEISQEAPKVGTLYYASHIQCLIKSQRDDLFKVEPILEVSLDGEEDDVDLKIGNSEDYQGQDLELCLGQDKIENEKQYKDDDIMDYQESGSTAHWLLDGKNHMNNHFLRPCNLNEAQNLESQYMSKDDADDEGYAPRSKSPTLGELASTDPFQQIGSTSITYSPSLRHAEHSSGDFMYPGADAHFNSAGDNVYANDYKRDICDDDIADHHDLHARHKRMRNDVSSSGFNYCLEQMHQWMNKARVVYEEKEQAANARMNDELLFSNLQQQNHELDDDLRKTRFELQKKQMENYKLEHELHLMTNLIQGYRKALKENERAFSEYRKRNPEPEEPLYMDVGPGGLVLSVKDYEKQCREREEEEKMQRRMFEEMCENFQIDWFTKFKELEDMVDLLNQRLLELEKKFKSVKELLVKPKLAEVSQEV
ncbi:hypothetical protein AQUCO_00500110v1 [Aquilegia coerulea]|uniref:Uncharacterized protein n=1 Tax=Aquilegia coerulea TaxID=218851 RepID=A0A2G5EQE4_AQUCA|nr:hypothetical protein AQUCO_00500110v1 [Aquilegia coerulea]